MSADIGPGDVVVCVDASPVPESDYPAILKLLRVGRAYRVGKVMPFDGRPPSLVLPEVHAWESFYAWRFRKIDKADDEWIAKIRATTPSRERVSA